MNRSVLIPMRCIRHVDAITLYNRPEINVGDIYEFCPTDYIDLDLKDVNCFEDIPNEQCDFICQIANLSSGVSKYSWNDLVDYKEFTEDSLNNLLELGYIKKVVKKNTKIETKIEAKSETKRPLHQFLADFSIDKENIIDYIKGLGIDIQDKRSWITSSQEELILESLTNNGN